MSQNNEKLDALTDISKMLIQAIHKLENGSKAQTEAIKDLRSRLDTVEALILAQHGEEQP